VSLADDLTSLETILQDVVIPAGERPIQRIFKNPRSEQVQGAERPCILLFCRKPSQVSGFTFGSEKRVSEIVIQLIYCEDGEGLLVDNYLSVLQYSENILDVLWAHIRLSDEEGTPTVNWALPTSAGVPGTLKEKWNGKNFFGADILLQVTDSRGVTITD
jgi:hypothetical protein